MNNKNILLVAGAAGLSLGLIALPGISRSAQDAPPAPQELTPPAAPAAPKVITRMNIVRTPQGGVIVGAPDGEPEDQMVMSFSDDGGSWLGVETQEVTADKVKDLKLSAERGVVIGKVLEDSPAAKAGLKDGDVVTDINGQRVEGTAQFRRMIREIPAGRSVQLTVSRGGRSQNITATLGKMQENRKQLMRAMPQVFNFRVPEMPEVAPVPDMPSIEWDHGNLLMGRPRLGIDAEDITGQLGTYFGAPDGEGILVRDVNAGSAAEKAGVKAGDVITLLNSERIHGLAELRSKLAAAGEGKTAKLGVLRNKSSLTLDVEIPAPKTKSAHKIEMRTKI
jgi:membrane-associated protease RseP (regulator of RpoE activity)